MTSVLSSARPAESRSANNRRGRRAFRVVAAAGLVALAGSCCFLGPPSSTTQQASRRSLLGYVAASAAAAAGVSIGSDSANAARNRLPPNFEGRYRDNEHPGCRRQVVKYGDKFMISYAYDNEYAVAAGGKGCISTSPGQVFQVKGKPGSTEDEIVVDWSPLNKGGNANEVVGKWVDNGITFPDGCRWDKMGNR
eukprot:TRINITY_DN1400_c1_g1_i2.p2 TRINITY_DN1400_c1_g1~~TRINITY_DN1400_c1_g1_i2.p2  ORF type:complete len:194 (+),score=49.40 TRINITY_DN1400_c1_g1_i2:118-699(+)